MAPEPLVRRVFVWAEPDRERFPWTLPAFRGFQELRFDARVTFLVGENGSGKSTLLESIAALLDVDAGGGDRDIRFEERVVDTDMHAFLRLERGSRRPSMRYFLRAESFYNVASDEQLRMSHGESFISLANDRFYPDGMFVLDEPEAALSPTGLLTLMRRMHDLAGEGAQFIVATHSPILLAFPGALIYELTADGPAETAYLDTEHYRLTRAFLDAPERFLRELLRD
jgi:predicted ATPase